VTAGAPLLTLHTDTPDRFDRALEALHDAFEIGQHGVAPADVVIERVG
jgi:thymidine phosphorylase